MNRSALLVGCSLWALGCAASALDLDDKRIADTAPSPSTNTAGSAGTGGAGDGGQAGAGAAAGGTQSTGGASAGTAGTSSGGAGNAGQAGQACARGHARTLTLSLGPALYFPFDDAAGANTVTEVVAGSDGKPSGPGVTLGATAAFDDDGANLASARFTPSAESSGVLVGGALDFGAGAFTVSLFYRVRGAVECIHAFAKQTIWEEGLGYNAGTSLHFRCGGSSTALFNRNPYDDQKHTYGEYVKPPLPAAEVWEHLVVRYDPTFVQGMRAFVNGKVYTGPGAVGLSGGTISTKAPLMLGAAARTDGVAYNTFEGDLDEIAFFTRALGDDEIRGIACAAGFAK